MCCVRLKQHLWLLMPGDTCSFRRCSLSSCFRLPASILWSNRDLLHKIDAGKRKQLDKDNPKGIYWIYCATGAFLSKACLCTFARAKIYPISWRAAWFKLLQCIFQKKSLSLLGLKENIAGQNESLSNRHTHTIAQKLAQSMAHVHQFSHLSARKMWFITCSNENTESHWEVREKPNPFYPIYFQCSMLVIAGQLVFWGPTLTKLAPSSSS